MLVLRSVAGCADAEGRVIYLKVKITYMPQLSLDNPTAETDTSTTSAEPRPYKVIEPKSGWQALNLRELWQFRDLLLMLVQRDVRLRYKQTVLGVAWVVLQPLISAAIFTFVFSKVANLPSPPAVPCFVFAYTGLLAWNLFSNTLAKLSASPVAYAMTHVPIKSRTIFLLNPISTLLEGPRWSMINRGSLQPDRIVFAAVFSVGVFDFGAFAFRRMERKFADVI